MLDLPSAEPSLDAFVRAAERRFGRGIEPTPEWQGQTLCTDADFRRVLHAGAAAGTGVSFVFKGCSPAPAQAPPAPTAPVAPVVPIVVASAPVEATPPMPTTRSMTITVNGIVHTIKVMLTPWVPWMPSLARRRHAHFARDRKPSHPNPPFLPLTWTYRRPHGAPRIRRQASFWSTSSVMISAIRVLRSAAAREGAAHARWAW